MDAYGLELKYKSEKKKKKKWALVVDETLSYPSS